MPEMPEVAAVASALDDKLRGRVIASGHLVSFSALKTFRIGLEALAGLETDRVTRHGKFIDVDAQGVHLIFHLARAGWVHSVEVWDADGVLVGGLYGVHVAGLFAGESMFHDDERGRDASKVALIRLVVELAAVGVELLDVQWLTEHLGTLGAYEVPRAEYLRRLEHALTLPTLPWTRFGPLTGAELLAEHDAVAAGRGVLRLA